VNETCDRWLPRKQNFEGLRGPNLPKSHGGRALALPAHELGAGGPASQANKPFAVRQLTVAKRRCGSQSLHFSDVRAMSAFRPLATRTSGTSATAIRRIRRRSCHLVGVGFLYFVTIGGAPGSGGGALTTAKAGAGMG
jgi:hypothetical protein